MSKTITPETIKSLRKGLGLSQDEFAQLIGVKQPSVCRWENADTKPNGAAVKMLEIIERGQVSA